MHYGILKSTTSKEWFWVLFWVHQDLRFIYESLHLSHHLINSHKRSLTSFGFWQNGYTNVDRRLFDKHLCSPIIRRLPAHSLDSGGQLFALSRQPVESATTRLKRDLQWWRTLENWLRSDRCQEVDRLSPFSKAQQLGEFGARFYLLTSRDLILPFVSRLRV
jgi:hypothetical protein